MLGAVITIRSLAIWQTAFFDTGAMLFVYNIARLVFTLFSIAMLCAIGEFLLRRFTPGVVCQGGKWSAATRAFFLGAALTSLLGAALAAIGALRFWVLLPLGVVLATLTGARLAVWMPSWRRTWEHTDWRNRLGIFLLVSEVLFLASTKGTAPDAKVVDTLGHYLPYYQAVLDAGGVVYPTPLWINYFFIKGAGLPLVMAGLTDITLVQWAAFVCFLGSGGVVANWLTVFGGRRGVFVVGGLLVYFSSGVLLGSEFQKTHMISGAFLLFVFDSALRWRPATQRSHLLAPTAVAIALTVMTPAYSLFLGVALSSAMAVSFIRFGVRALAPTLIVGGISSVALVATLVTNRISTGMFEITPFSAAPRLADPARHPPDLLVWHTRYEIAEAPAIRPPHDTASAIELAGEIWRFMVDGLPWLENWPSDLAIVGLLSYVAVLCALVASRRNSIQRRAIALAALLVVAALLMLRLAIDQPSFLRGLTFMPALRVLLLIAAGAFVWQLVIRERTPQAWIAYIALGFFSAVATNGLAAARTQGTLASLDLFFGRASFAGYYRFRLDDPCTEARRVVGPDKAIVLLHFVPSCVGKPTDRVEYGEFERYLGSPEQVRARLQAEGIEYFLFVPNWPIYVTAFAPVFQPEIIERDFEVAAVLTHGYLLTWRHSDTAYIPSALTRVYRTAIWREQASDDAIWLQEWQRRRAVLSNHIPK